MAPLNFFTRYLTLVNSLYSRINLVEQSHYLEQEAFTTCIIEGARTTIADTLRLSNGEEPRTKSEQMVFNSLKVIKSLRSLNITSNKFTEDHLVNLWRDLVHNSCENEEIMGSKYRSGDVSIINAYSEVTFKPLSYEKVSLMMKEFFKLLQNNDTHPILGAIIIHYAFVYIHPFCDGNGRMGRLLLNQYLLSRGLSKFTTLSITTEVFKNLRGYYTALEESENELNDITFFVLYYLEVISRLLNKASTGFGTRLEDLEGSLSKRQLKVTRFLRENQGNFTTQTRYAYSYGVSKSVAAKELNSLVNLGLLKKERHGVVVYKWCEYNI